MTEYIRARKAARKEGIRITDKYNLCGYRVSYDWLTGNYLTQLYYYSWGNWEMYDFAEFGTKWAARESGRKLTKG